MWRRFGYHYTFSVKAKGRRFGEDEWQLSVERSACADLRAEAKDIATDLARTWLHDTVRLCVNGRVSGAGFSPRPLHPPSRRESDRRDTPTLAWF
jgi:hypothetical protein